MFSTLRTRFGIPGVISVIALVFAMFGGAYAASNSSGGGKATASKTKTVKGPRGPKGATGPAGPQGPAGPAGAKGDAGTNGSNGTNGTNGTSATTAAYSGTECANGGVEVKSVSPTAYVCNGEDGQTGFTETLPTGKSEYGTWGAPKAVLSEASISFNIPLESAVPAHFIAWEETPAPTAECPGTYEEPAAAPGNLCIYASEEVYGTFVSVENVENYTHGEAGKSGARLTFENILFPAYGDWAVTAP